MRSDINALIRDFMLCKYFTQKKERRGTIQKIMQAVYDRTGQFIQLEQDLDYLKGTFPIKPSRSKGR